MHGPARSPVHHPVDHVAGHRVNELHRKPRLVRNGGAASCRPAGTAWRWVRCGGEEEDVPGEQLELSRAVAKDSDLGVTGLRGGEGRGERRG